MTRQPGGDTWLWEDALLHRPAQELPELVARFQAAGVTPDDVMAALADGGDQLHEAATADGPDWPHRFGGAFATALLATEVSALAAHLNSRAAAVRSRAVEALPEDFSAVSVAADLRVSRQKVYDIAGTPVRSTPYIRTAPWRVDARHA